MPKIATDQTKNLRNRNYATIVYPDSAPVNWMQILEDMHIPALISPIHDLDVAPDGTLKKAHYHVLVMYESLKSLSQAEKCVTAFGGVGTESINSLPAYGRYLIHLDNPDKAQYNAADVIALGGADYIAVAHVSDDTPSVLRDIFAYIRTNQLTSFARLIDLCAVNNDIWFRELISHNRCNIIINYMKSMQWELSKDIGGPKK